MKKNLAISERSGGWQENLKSILLLGSLVALGLYLLSRVLFNEFETTVGEEIRLMGKIWLASLVLVISSSVVLILVGTLAAWLGRRRSRDRVMQGSGIPGKARMVKKFA